MNCKRFPQQRFYRTWTTASHSSRNHKTKMRTYLSCSQRTNPPPKKSNHHPSRQTATGWTSSIKWRTSHQTSHRNLERRSSRRKRRRRKKRLLSMWKSQKWWRRRRRERREN